MYRWLSRFFQRVSPDQVIKIQLPNGTWTFHQAKPLGTPGGFGAVFLGQDGDGKPVAIKRIHSNKQNSAVRELDIAEYLLGHSHPHIIPILDAGRDSASGDDFIVMPQAIQSLQDLVDKSAPVPEPDALAGC
jgi:eukaryotic-like serine/threonine-protein kinase